MPSEIETFLQAIRAMFEKPDYHYPIVAAQRQYRERYYGMASAASLEDLFFDAFSSYLRIYEPLSQLARPPRGSKGYDYEFNELRISHKVSKGGPLAIAALWDATKTNVQSWSFNTPINFSSGDYSRKTLGVTKPGSIETCRISPASGHGVLKDGDHLILATWTSHSELCVDRVWKNLLPTSIRGALPFPEIWQAVTESMARQGRANAQELFVLPHGSRLTYGVGTIFSANDGTFRPGTYVFDRTRLTEIQVEHNNRAILIPKDFVASLMRDSLRSDDFVPTTTWFSIYAGLNPPDLYLAQRADYDRMFSAYSQTP